ncbi:MAG: DUF3015 domain-containing protein [Nitrospiria bacterium]
MKKVIVMIAGFLFFAPSAFAAGYGDAGCGLGSMVFGDAPGPVQIFAATTNGTSYSQGFGITSGTSNCDASGVILAERADDVFVVQNFDSLAKEMATGEGEHLTTLAGLLGCSADKNTEFASFTQQNYEAIFVSDQTTSAEMLSAVKREISSHPEFSSSCVN